MILSVIVPDDRPGMQRMLANELQFIESEIIYDEWRPGLKKAQGDFICLLEHDSGVSKGTFQRLLKPFNENPSYRKLVLVSPLVEFEDSEPLPLRYGSEARLSSSELHLTRVGCVPGGIIRRSSLLKYKPGRSRDVIDFSYKLSLTLWEHGLRIMNDPSSIYYSPTEIEVSYRPKRVKEASSALSELWQRECVV